MSMPSPQPPEIATTARPGLLWRLLWPVRLYYQRFPIHRGKGAIERLILVPALPAAPGGFSYRLGNGDSVALLFREDLGREVILGGGYEDAEIAVLAGYVAPGSHVLDVGANIGLSALVLADGAGGNCRVLAVEAHPRTAARLRANLAGNAKTNVTVLETAAGAREGTITFHESADATLNSATIVPKGAVRSFSVPVSTLDRIWDDAGRPPVSVVKIDVEGGELDVLKGASALLAARTPAILLEAWGEGERAPIDALLAAHGYAAHQPEGFAVRNFLYLKA